MRELTWLELRFGAFVLCAIPVCIIGFGLGLWGDEIGGSKLDAGTVLMRGTYCALFPAILAWFTRNAWIPLTPVYMAGFGMSFGSKLSLRLFPESIIAFFSCLEGKRMILPTPSSHPDLPWIFAIALWLIGLARILRRSTRFAAAAGPLDMRG